MVRSAAKPRVSNHARQMQRPTRPSRRPPRFARRAPQGEVGIKQSLRRDAHGSILVADRLISIDVINAARSVVASESETADARTGPRGKAVRLEVAICESVTYGRLQPNQGALR